MNAMTGSSPVWWGDRVGIERLTVHTDERTVVVPETLAAVLLGRQGPGLSADPSDDLLRLEALLRGWVRDAGDVVDRYSLILSRALCHEQSLDGRWWRVQWWEAFRARQDSEDLLAEAMAWHRVGAGHLVQLRQLVIELGPRAGLLAEAVAGWSRRPDVPAGVSVYANEDVFLSDRRRGDPRMPTVVVGGVEFGQMWRRDGDDPVDQPLERPGCWTVGFIARTGEIYAVRRGDRDPRTVWLLGRGFSESRARQVLEPLLQRQPEPNSLLLVAETVGAACHEPPSEAELSADPDPAPQPGPGP